MTLIDGDRIVTAQLYDDEHEEFTEKKMSIIDYINAYTDEGVTEADVVEQTRWIPCSERLPEVGEKVLCQCQANIYEVLKLAVDGWYHDSFHCYMKSFVVAWCELPEPYKASPVGAKGRARNEK